MKLHYAPQSPFARKVRAAAIEVGLGDRIELVATSVMPGRKNQAFADTINPLRKIPALVLPSGEVLVDSSVIGEYLDAAAGGGKLIPPGGDARWRVLVQHAIAQGMTDAVILVRYETAVRPEPQRWSAWIEDQWDKAWTGLDWFEERAASALAAGASLDLSQLALACFLGYVDFRFPDAGWRARAPAVAAWLDRVAARPSLARTRPYDPPPA